MGHKVQLPESLVASGRYEEFAKGPGARHGRSNSLKWPWLYDKLRAKGYDKSKAAAISNSRIHLRKKGRISVLSAKAAHSPAVLKRLAKADKAGKHSTKGTLKASAAYAEFACYTKECAPPPVGKGGSGKGFRPITAAQARGDSLPVSAVEFQAIAAKGKRQLDRMAANSSPITGLKNNLDKVKADTYAEVQKEWGGATINAHQGGRLFADGRKPVADIYALTVKGKGGKTVLIPMNASKEEFDAAMDTAIKRFEPVLKRQDHYLGVFRDDANNRIDFDPVIVTTKRSDVDTIGAASHSIGGAYNFRDGNGYWPPHVRGE